MSAISGFALGAAPIAGGALLGLAAGNLRGPDVRGAIKADLELLEKLPPRTSSCARPSSRPSTAGSGT